LQGNIRQAREYFERSQAAHVIKARLTEMQSGAAMCCG